MYSETAEYEKGDFVVSGSTIYVCSPQSGSSTVQGEDPRDSKNFTAYLGEQMTSLQDYLEFVEAGGGKDKYISLEFLPAILNSYNHGVTGKGIIGSGVTWNEEKGIYEVIIDGIPEKTKYVNPKTVLADILLDPDINNGVFRISRSLPEVVAYLSLPSSLVTSRTSTLDKESCVLRQYTYTGSTGIKVRIQEVIDHIDGQIYYRSGTLDSSVGSLVDSGWRCATTGSEGLRDKANKLFSLYASRIKSIEALGESLRRNFRYHLASITQGSVVTLQNASPAISGYLKTDNISEISYIGVNILVSTGTGIYESHDFSFDPQSEIKTYKITTGVTASIQVSYDDTTTKTSGRIKITLTGDGASIKSVWYQEFYEV
jgi:hypothetical protein